MNVIKDNAKWEAGLVNDIDTCKRDGPNFGICIISQRFANRLWFFTTIYKP